MLSLVIVVVTIVVQSLSRVRHFVTPWTVAHQAPLSMGFPRQDYWSGLPFPAPGDLPNPRIKPVSPTLAKLFFTTEPPGKPAVVISRCMCVHAQLLQPCPTL